MAVEDLTNVAFTPNGWTLKGNDGREVQPLHSLETVNHLHEGPSWHVPTRRTVSTGQQRSHDQRRKMRDVKAHAVAGVAGQVKRDDFAVPHGKDILLGQDFGARTRHIRIVAIGPRGEKIPRFKSRLSIGVDVNGGTAKRL